MDEDVQFFPAEMYHLQQQQETQEAVLWQPVTSSVPAELEEPGNGAPGGSVAGTARKRPFRTDRHSKIRTAQGVRDRRMRLSVGVARDFFALQDLLGFDKASKTVDWLLTQSKPAIDRLSEAAPGATAASPIAASVKEKGDAASSSSTACFRDAIAPASERSMERMKSIGGDGSAMEPMEGLDYFHQYCQLEEMMRAATTQEY